MYHQTYNVHPATFRDRMPPFLVGAATFVVSGIFILIFGVLSLAAFWGHRHLTDWPAVPAVVEESRVIQRPSHDDKFFIQYRYTYNHQEYHSQSYWLSPMEPPNPNLLAKQYPVGSAITVHINAAKPGHAFITAAPLEWWEVAFALLGLTFFCWSIYMMWRSLTAACIIMRRQDMGGGGVSGGWAFYFFNSMEAAQQAVRPVSLPQTQGDQRMTRIGAFLGSLMFAAIGVAGMIILLLEHQHLPGLAIAFGSIMSPLCIIMGIGGMRQSVKAKYVLHQKDSIGHNVVSFADSEEQVTKIEEVTSKFGLQD